MNIQEQMQQDVKAAMRSGDRKRLDVLRMALAALKNAEMALVKDAFDAAAKADDAAAEGAPIAVALSDADMQQTITKEVKRRHDAAELYTKGGRADLAAEEEAEAVILETYLPRQLTADELRPLLAEAIARQGAGSIADMGKVMPALMQEFKGKADGRMISQLAREILAAPRP